MDAKLSVLARNRTNFIFLFFLPLYILEIGMQNKKW